MAVHPSTWLLAVVSLGIVSWSVLTMLVEPIPFPDSSWMRWQTPWTAVLLMCSSAALLTALLGFSPHISLVWLRPVVVTASAAVILAWVATASLVPDPAVRLAYVAVSAVAGFVPATATFAVGVADSGRGLGGVIVVLMVTAAAGGVAIGYQTTLAVIPLGFALVAVAACGTWAMATTPWVMLVSVGPLVVFATAVLVCAVRMVAAGGPPTRVLGLALIGSLLLGQVATIPLGWAMLGDAPSTSGAMIASGRLDAGFTVAVASLAASWTWIARARLRRPAVGASPWPGSAGKPVVVTDRP
jgi:hypothetical protein